MAREADARRGRAAGAAPEVVRVDGGGDAAHDGVRAKTEFPLSRRDRRATHLLHHAEPGAGPQANESMTLLFACPCRSANSSARTMAHSRPIPGHFERISIACSLAATPQPTALLQPALASERELSPCACNLHPAHCKAITLAAAIFFIVQILVARPTRFETDPFPPPKTPAERP